jgi:hypothetical protein
MATGIYAADGTYAAETANAAYFCRKQQLSWFEQ